jgi:hypothetical protein
MYLEFWFNLLTPKSNYKFNNRFKVYKLIVLDKNFTQNWVKDDQIIKLDWAHNQTDVARG